MANISRIEELNIIETPKRDKQSIREFFEEMELPYDEIEKRITIANDLDMLYERLFLILTAVASLGKIIEVDYYAEYLIQGIKDILSANGFDVADSKIIQYVDYIAPEVINNTLEHINSSYFLSEDRAESLACDESNEFSNYAMEQQAILDGYTRKKWVTKLDNRVRKTHIHADGQIVPINTPFTVGKYEMLFPLDTSLGAGAEEIANCRCVCKYLK